MHFTLVPFTAKLQVDIDDSILIVNSRKDGNAVSCSRRKSGIDVTKGTQFPLLAVRRKFAGVEVQLIVTRMAVAPAVHISIACCSDRASVGYLYIGTCPC